MPEESAVLDAPVEETQEQTEETPTELEHFNPDEYKHYFPEGCEAALSAILTPRKYGWIKRAKILVKMHNAEEHMKALSQQLVDLCSTRTRGPNVIQPNAGLRAWLVSRSNEVLQSLCSQYGVSYTSFMPEGAEDRSNLVDALLDEMMSTE